MGHRLSKIYTRTGDDGTTGLGDGSRVGKSHLRVEAMGDVDEAQSTLGVLLTEKLPERVRDMLTRIQHELFEVGGELSIPGAAFVTADDAAQLEKDLDELNAALKPLKEFILPGGSRGAALCHLARAVCRRAERRVVALAEREQINPHARTYLNRLSDLLFVCARFLNAHDGAAEVLWKPRDHRPSR
jgi:cob(I)alamin adenosyltransferase